MVTIVIGFGFLGPLSIKFFLEISQPHLNIDNVSHDVVGKKWIMQLNPTPW